MRRIVGLCLVSWGCSGTPSAPPVEPPAPAEPVATEPPPPPATGGPVSGPVFRAIGQEPGWTLVVTSDKGVDALAYVGDYGSVHLDFPSAARSEDNTRTTWTASAGGHALTVSAEHKACQDAMSGNPFPATVRLVIDGRTLDGCGGATP